MLPQQTDDLGAHVAVCDGVEVAQRHRVGEHDLAQRLALQLAVCHRTGETRAQLADQLGIVPQQSMIHVVAVDGKRAHLAQHAQRRGLARAGAAGDADNGHPTHQRVGDDVLIERAAAQDTVRRTGQVDHR